MQAGKQQLLEFLDNLGISVETFTHKAVFHVEEGRDIKENIPGAHRKKNVTLSKSYKKSIFKR